MLDWMGLSFENGVLRIMDHEFTWGRLADLLAYQPDAPMLFSSGLFFFLFIGFSVFYYLLRKKMMARIIYVTLFSLYFYYKSSGLWFGLLVFTATSDFFIGHYLAKATTVRARKALVTLSLCVNLGMLAYFKYFNREPGHAGLFQVFQLPAGLADVDAQRPGLLYRFRPAAVSGV